MKSILKSIILIFLMMQVQNVFAQFRDVDSSAMIGDIPIVNSSKTKQQPSQNTISDNNKKLYGMVGKSQILNFDTGIKRVSIADPNIADVVVVSPQQLIVNGKKTGSTSLIFWGKNSASPVFYNLIVQQDADSFLEAVNMIAPNEDITIIFNNSGAVMSGFISSASIREQIQNLAKAYEVNLTDLTESPTKQVLLEVRVTEASKNFTRDLGVELGLGNTSGVVNEALSNMINANPGKTGISQVFSSSGLSYYLFDRSSKISMAIQA